ncbi:MAG: DUF362 domain-containing protein [Syntrophales bacterium LBB04]|nr:DUF362 domain-containing protein [Syntrophales bacterium LBB04]
MSKVLVVDSSYETCGKAVDRAFSAFPLDLRGKRVAVKVNALKAGDPDRQAFVTHYKLLKAVIEKLETLKPSKILVGDSVGTESYGNSEHVFQTTRLKEAAGPYYRNFSRKLMVVELQTPFKRKIAVLKDVIDADVYISLPKMKTHGLTMLSGSVKNNFGLLAGAQKSWYHYYSVKPEVFARIIIEMFRLRPPDLVIMDGILAMEGYGPASPETRWVNKILASDDAVALDTVLAQMVGFRIEDVPYLQLARVLRLGQTDLKAIQVLGDARTIEEYHRPTPPEASYSYRAGVGTGSTSIEYYRQRVAYRPVIDLERCRHPQGCTACLDVCPVSAFTHGDTIPGCKRSECILCSACKEVCDFAALTYCPDEDLMAALAKQPIPALDQ